MATASILPVIFLLHFFNLIESSQKINLHGIWSLNDESNGKYVMQLKGNRKQ